MIQAIETVLRYGPSGRHSSPEADPVSAPAEAIAFLQGVRLFKEFTATDLADLAARLRERKLRRGEVLFHEGEAGEEMFFVRRGTVIISKAVTGRVEEVLARMGPGEFFGEMSLFDGAPRSATVRAESDVLLLALDRESFQRFVAASPRVAAVFFRAQGQAVVEHLRGANHLVAEVTRWGLEATGLDASPTATCVWDGG